MQKDTDNACILCHFVYKMNILPNFGRISTVVVHVSLMVFDID